MITQIKTFLEVTLRNFGRNRLRSQLLCSSDRVLEDMGFSRELLLQGVSAWPWREDGEQNEAKVYSIFSEHEKEVQRAIKELESYSDRELADMGIVRCDIESLVRNGREETDMTMQHPKAA